MWEWLKNLFNRNIEDPFPASLLTEEEQEARAREFWNDLFPRD